MRLEAAQYKAAALRQLLQPFCDRIAIAGSIRRGKPEPEEADVFKRAGLQYIHPTERSL